MTQRVAVKVRRAGTEKHHSYIMTIPAEVVPEMELKHGDYPGIGNSSDTIILRKMKR